MKASLILELQIFPTKAKPPLDYLSVLTVTYLQCQERSCNVSDLALNSLNEQTLDNPFNRLQV